MLKNIIAKNSVRAFLFYLIILVTLFSSVFFKGHLFGGGDTTAAKGMSHQLSLHMSETGEYPLWQPYIFSGMPAFSSMMFTKWVYFPNFIIGLINKLGIPSLWTMLFHYLLAAMGGYTLLRHLKLDVLASILGGLAYMLAPFFIVMISAGHGSQMMTAAYLPWLIYALKRIFDKPDISGMLILALVAGLQFQRGHVQIAYYGWMASGWYVMIEIFFRIKSKDWGKFPISTAYMLGGMLLGLGLAAVLYIPTLSYAAYSIRGGSAGGGLDYGYATSWSFPPYEILALFFSDWFGFGGQTYWGGKPFTEHSDYLGMALMILMFSAFLNKELFKEKIYLISTIFLALLVSFGNYWPYLYDVLFKVLPFFNKFRVPSMIMILLELMAALLAGIGLYTLLSLNQTQRQSWEKKILIATAAMGGIFVLALLFKTGSTNMLAGVLNGSEKAHPALKSARLDMFYTSFIKSLFIGTASLAMIWSYFSGKIKGFYLAVGMIAIVLMDLVHVDLRFADNAVAGKRLQASEQETPAISKLKSLTQTNPGRIFPVHSFFGSNVWAMHGLESIGGYSPAKLKILQDFLNSTQIEQTFLPKYYSQTATGAAPKQINEVDPALRKRHLDVLRTLNVKYLVSPYPLNDPLFKLVEQSAHINRGQRAQALIYEFTDDYPRAWFAANVAGYSNSGEVSANISRSAASPLNQVYVLDPEGMLSTTSYGQGEVIVKDKDLHKLTLQTENKNDGFLVISDVFYPGGWNAYLDGESVSDVYLTNELIRGMVVPAGNHEVEFRYEPASVRTGFIITLLSVLIMAGLFAYIIYSRRMTALPD